MPKAGQAHAAKGAGLGFEISSEAVSAWIA